MFRYLLPTKVLARPEEGETRIEWSDRLCGEAVDMVEEGGHVLLDLHGRECGLLFSVNGEIPEDALETHGLRFYDEL